MTNDTGEFTRIVFGLMNAPFYFAKLMQRVLVPFRDENILFYVDHVSISGKGTPTLRRKIYCGYESREK